MLLVNNKIVQSVMDFLAYDIIPFILLQSANDDTLPVTSKIFIDFVTRIAHCLEGMCAEEFPSNSLNVVMTIQKSLNFIKESCVTPDTQVNFL